MEHRNPNNMSMQTTFNIRPVILTVLLSLLFALGASAQDHVTIHGTVKDRTGRPIPNASIQELNGLGGAVANAQGRFFLESLSGRDHDLTVSAVGYASLLVSVPKGSDSVFVTMSGEFRRLDDVWVTAEKRDAAAQRAPVAMTVLSARQVRDYRIWDLSDLTGLVPNMYTANPGDDRNVTSIRGITTTSYDPAVATYIDGVNQFTLDTYLSPLLDVERIEVLRGPQGTLYGRNAMGGVINVITRKPTNQPRAFAELSIGNHNSVRASAGLATALIKDKLFVGVALQYDGRKGYYTNDFNGKDFDRRKTISGNYYIKYLAPKDWSFQLNIHHNNHRNDGAFPLAVDPSTVYSDAYHVNQNSLATMKDDGADASFTVRHTGKKTIFLSQTAYQTNYRIYDAPLDADFSSLDAIRIFNNFGLSYNRVRAWTQEFRLHSADRSKKLSWDAGAYFFAQNNPNRQATQFGPDAPYLGIPDTGVAVITTNHATGKGMALYGQATYALSHALDVTVGLRGDIESREMSVMGEYQVFPGPPMTVRPDTSAKANFHALTPKLALSWHAGPDKNVYLAYSRGYRTGGISQLSSDPSQAPLLAYQPEFSNNFELGTRNEFLDHRLRLNAALFYTTVRDVQVPILVLPDAITVVKNAGALNSKGVEVELTTVPVKGLELQANFGYTDAKYKSLPYGDTSYSGNRQVFTPDVNSLLAAQYTLPLDKTGQMMLVLRGEFKYTGKQYFDLANRISQDAYSLVNLKVGFRYKRTDLSVWARNLGGTKYISYAYDFGGMHLGPPMTWGVTLRQSFSGIN